MKFGGVRWFAAILTLSLLVLPTVATGKTDREYMVKAAFIYNFARFVRWPQITATHLKICLPGNQASRPEIESISGKEIGGLPIQVHSLVDPQLASTCHLAFLGHLEPAETERWLRTFDGQRVLTVGDQPGFLEAGGMINLVNKRDKIKFEINLAPARRAGLQVSSKLIRLAIRVEGQGADQ